MAYTLVPTELIVDGAITSAKLDTNIAISGTLGVTGEVTLATHLVMGDNDKIKIGTGGDLEIYHDGSNSYISNSTGNIYLADTNGAVHIQAKLNEESIVCAADGAVSLYHDNAVKLATSSAGVSVTGTAVTDGLTATGVIVTEGDAAVNDAQIGRLNFTNTNSNASSNPIRASILSGRQNSAWGGYLSLYTSTGTSAASEKVRITETGNVGISTVTIPHGGVGHAKFAIDGTNANSAGPHVQYTTSTDDYPVLQQLNWSHDNISLNFDSYFDGVWRSSDAGSNFQIYKNADLFSINYDSGIAAGSAVTWNYGLTMKSDGSVGIGTTSPDALLEVSNITANDIPFFISGGTASLGSLPETTGMAFGYGSAAGYKKGAIIWEFTATSALGKLHFCNDGVADAGNAQLSDSKMTIDSSGKVGINETSPSKLLHITSDTDYEGMLIKGSGHKQLTIESTSGSRQVLATFTSASQNMSIGLDTDNAFIFHSGTASAERMRITNTGTFLVSATTASGLSNGTSNYGHSFGGGQQVNATNNDTNLILNMSNGSSNPHVQFRSDGGNTGSISTNGSAVAFNTGSDYRLKENVIPLKDGLNRVNKLKPVQFDWKKSQETDEGFIAHEVQEIVPYVVKGEKDGEEIQTMDYAKLTPLLVKAIQEQQTVIEDLKSRIETLEG